MHYFGQLAALNDCLYRAAMTSRFVVFTDLDELLVPRHHATWAELIDDVTRLWRERNAGGGRFPGAYLAQNTFFRNDWGSDDVTGADDVIQRLGLKTLLTTKREGTIHPWNQRSKYIVWARLVHIVGVHNVIQFVDDGRVESVYVGAEDALLQHYRPEMWPDDPNNPPQRVLDRRMHAFKDQLVHRANERHRKVMHGD